jgi:hypothetical protein
MQQLEAIQAQSLTWKPHSRTSLCWGFFIGNDNLHVDFEKPQMLQCIICRTKQTSALNLCQGFTL